METHWLEKAREKVNQSRVRVWRPSLVSTSFALFQASHPYNLKTRRRILLFPFGNSNAPPNDTVSVYLDYADPKRAPEGWHACAQFALVISNPHDPTIYTVSRTCLSDVRDHTSIYLVTPF